MLHDAFAFDESGSKLATIRFTAQGRVELAVGPPGGKPRRFDLSSFTSTPEKILGLGGYWFVVSNEGKRRAAIVDGSGRIRRTTQAFDDCELSLSPKAFVTVSESNEPGGSRRFSIAAYRPDGGTLMLKDVVVEGNGTIVGGGGATFLGFTSSHFAAMVERPGAFDRKTDVRQPPQFALYDVKSGKTGPGKTPPKLDNFLDYVHKRGEKPDQPAVIVLAAGTQKGFELVGPGEKVRPLRLPLPAVGLRPGLAGAAPGGRQGGLLAAGRPAGAQARRHGRGGSLRARLLQPRPGQRQGDLDRRDRPAGLAAASLVGRRQQDRGVAQGRRRQSRDRHLFAVACSASRRSASARERSTQSSMASPPK